MGTVEGTEYDDIIDETYLGDPDGDLVDGGTGTGPGGGANDDIIVGLEGNDKIYGGDGGDVVFGGQDDDQLYGGDGDDFLKGNEGQDLVFGGAGNDSLLGHEGEDTLKGGDGDDTLDGGDGADWLGGQADRDLLKGGYGDYADGGYLGDDWDTLDLRGLGDYRIEEMRPDVNGNGYGGKVVFLSEAGEPTGAEMEFDEIEKIWDDENEDPVAVDDMITVEAGDTATLNALDNDSDPDGDTLTLTGVTAPAGSGTVGFTPDGTVTFTPAAGVTGDVVLDYTIEDGEGGSDVGQITVTVLEPNEPPVAEDDAATTPEETEITFPVLDNDSDPDGDPLTVTGATVDPALGTVTTDGTTVTFVPAAGVTGPVEISYTISDGEGGTDTAVLTVTVTDDNEPPVAEDDAATTPEETEITVPVLDNDSDPDGDPLTVTGATVDPALGTVTTDGTTVTFVPAAGVTGPVEIPYTISDGEGGTDTGVLTVTVTDVNDPPVAVDDPEFTTIPGETTIVPVLDNDSDPDGDPIRVISASAANGMVGINPDGTLSYTPNDGHEGPDLITYTITDDISGTSTATVPVMVRDGTVEGTNGDDLIDGSYTGDPEGDLVDANDAILPGDTGNDDLIYGYAGNDEIIAGNGDDEAYGGTGDDSIAGGGGDDTVVGGAGNDIVRGGIGNDTVYGGRGDDEVYGGAGDDTVAGGGGDDDIGGGSGDDYIVGGSGNDSILGGSGSDLIGGGAGDDYIDSSDGGPTGPGDFDNPYPPLPVDPFPNDDLDTVFAGAGNDTIFTGDDADVIGAGRGDDYVDAGIDNDSIAAGAGDDTVIGGEGSDTIYGQDGDDLIYGGYGPGVPDEINIRDDEGDLVTNNGMDVISAGAGNDTVYGLDDDDTIYGQTGDDLIYGGIDEDSIWAGLGDDTVFGGHGDDSIRGQMGDDILRGGEGDDIIAGNRGNDTVIGGEGADTLFGGADRDVFIGGDGGESVHGGAGGDDYDILDLSNTPFESITYTSADREDGFVTFADGSVLTFEEIENVIPCFTPGTTIATPRGERLVEELREGDRIITRDNGIQEIRWVGRKEITGKTLLGSPHLRPVLIKAGALGNGLPERDMMVSPNHRMLVASDRTQLYFEESEVLAAAKHLVGCDGIHEFDVMSTAYIHFMFDSHEVVLSNGAWTESFQPGDYSLKGIGNAQRNEILELFPELRSKEGLEAYQSARKSLKKHEARLLVR